MPSRFPRVVRASIVFVVFGAVARTLVVFLIWQSWHHASATSLAFWTPPPGHRGDISRYVIERPTGSTLTPGVAEHTAVTLDAPGFRDGYLGRWTEGGEPMTAIALRFDDATAAATYLTSAAQWLENEGWRSDTSTVPGGFVLVDRAVDADGYVPSVGLAQADDMVAEVYVYQQPPGGLSSPDSLLVREYAML